MPHACVDDPSRDAGFVDRLAMPLALAVTALLFLQWPLRDLAGAGATQANDLAQWLFAFYVAAAVRHAGRRGAHLSARPDLMHGDARIAAWRRIGAPLCVLPWALFLLCTGAGMAWESVRGLERFPETANPGYFLIKLAMLLMALLLAWQAAVDLLRALRRSDAAR